MNKYFIASLIFNLGLLTLFSVKYMRPETNFKESSFDCQERLLNQVSALNRVFPENIVLNYGRKSFELNNIIKSNPQSTFFLTGYESCKSCLDRELTRIANAPNSNIIVIANKNFEEKLIYYWKQNSLNFPLYFTDISDLNLDENHLSQPSYFQLDENLIVKNFILTYKDDSWNLVENYFKQIK